MDKLLALSFLSLLLSTQASVNWSVHEKITKYGETLLLFCKLDECCSETAGWGKWKSSSRFETIVLGVKDSVSNAESKYDGQMGKNGFYLFIRNVSESDLNVNYSCTYGFLTSPQKSLSFSDVFEGTNSTLTKTVGISKKIYVIIIILALLAAVFFCVVIYMCRHNGKPKLLNSLQCYEHSSVGEKQKKGEKNDILQLNKKKHQNVLKQGSNIAPCPLMTTRIDLDY